MSSNNPYKEFEKTETWKILENAIGDLVGNGDLIEKTDRKYLVGYICKLLDASQRQPRASRSD